MAFDSINDLITADKKQLKEGGVVGRPKKSSCEKKDKRIVSYLTSSELVDFEQIAEKNDLTVSQMARKIIIDKMRSIKSKEELPDVGCK